MFFEHYSLIVMRMNDLKSVFDLMLEQELLDNDEVDCEIYNQLYLSENTCVDDSNESLDDEDLELLMESQVA